MWYHFDICTLTSKRYVIIMWYGYTIGRWYGPLSKQWFKPPKNRRPTYILTIIEKVHLQFTIFCKPRHDLLSTNCSNLNVLYNRINSVAMVLTHSMRQPFFVNWFHCKHLLLHLLCLFGLIYSVSILVMLFFNVTAHVKQA